MFFAPPQVKSLSRYSQFGVYLKPKHFLIMLALAGAIHAVIIGIYAMMPRQEVIKIPVRVLNIKLGDGGGSVVQAPSPAPVLNDSRQGIPTLMEMPVRPLAKETPNASKAAQAMVDKDLSTHMLHKPVRNAVTDETKKADMTLSTPKQYVRANSAPTEAAAGGNAGTRGSNGRSLAGTPEGDEIIQRYEQTISLWMARHKIYPEPVKEAHIEGDAVVRIRIDREGRVLYSTIDRSSNNAMIDQAVLAMVQASDPVPAVPTDYPDGSQLEFLIPVSFRLQ
jgi:protein TonB